MNGPLNKQILANIFSVLCFSVIFSIYCCSTRSLLSKAELSSQHRATVNSFSEELIVIDAGHGGEDGGTVGINGVYEKELNLDVSKSLGTYLKFAGFEVVQTRTEDILLYDKNTDYKGRKKMLDLAERYKIGEQLMPDLFVSIHMNAFPDRRYSGLTVYYSPNDMRSYDAASRIRTDVIGLLQPDNNRELKKAGSNIYLLNRLRCPSVLVECGFLSNESECALLSSDEYRDKLSLILFSSISSFFHE